MIETIIFAIALLVFALVVVGASVKVVPQSTVFLVERFGRFRIQLTGGLHFITPFFDRVAYKVSVLERQLPEFKMSVITRDNVEVQLDTTVFYRITNASQSVYRIDNVDLALVTAATSIVRSGAGKLELDELQSSREAMNQEIATNLQNAALIWGIEITRTEITDVQVDEVTKDAQRQQLNAERGRRAAIAVAEGEKRAQELSADGEFYEAQKKAEATKVQADAAAYSTRVRAEADAAQTKLLADAIAANGQPAVDFEILKRQVDAMGNIAASPSTHTLILPTDITGVLGSLQTMLTTLRPPNDKK